MLATRNLFLDTEAIIAQNFNYANPVMRRLEELTKLGQARLLTTSITTREVESNIRERVRPIRAALKRFSKDHRIIATLDPTLSPIRRNYDGSVIEGALIDQYLAFLDRTKTEVVEVDVSSVGNIFDWYFAAKPPFGEGQKKSEFPDAFVIASLEKWCADNGEKLYVVGSDPDFRKYCTTSKNLISLERPAEFIEKVLTQEEATRAIERSVREHSPALEKAISTEFEGLGFYLDDEEGDVNAVTVKRVSIDEVSLLEIAAGTAKCELAATIVFAAEVIYDDLETAIWDSEDKVSIPMRTIRSEVERSENFSVILNVRLSREGNFEAVTSVKFEFTDVAISVDRYDQYS
jgi:hypothetical protein